MSWVVEQPLVILFVGAAFFALAASIWVQTRDRKAAIAVVGVVGMTGLWILAERLIETDAEQVEHTIRSIARDLERNDAQSVLRHISASDPSLRENVSAALASVTIQKVSIKRNLEAHVVRRGNGDVAEARFNAVAIVTDRAGLAGKQTVPRFVVVRLRNEDGVWHITSYETHDPRGAESGPQGLRLPDGI